ncbi:hypothetical protein [Amycolatopsis sp. BJA-103]|uniref:hypothetical protein n=1 Tax=unclassified Amycolatopsis TaxID=2618356 RepID=UPI001E4AAEF8|nr:hypothetical protein [Amycolatopsis sp. BJA-103]
MGISRNDFARLGTKVLTPWVWILLTAIVVVVGDTRGMARLSLLALAITTLLALGVGSLTTYGFGFRISPHVTATSAAVILLTFTFGPLLLLGGLLVAWACWSRMKLGEDSYPEAAAGAMLGLLAGGVGWLGLIFVLFS